MRAIVSWVTALSFLGVLFSVRPVSAQDTEIPNTLNRAAQYFLGSQDEVLVKVNVIGYIARPGQYMVPLHTDLLSLISFAGGVRDGANLGKVYIMRKSGSGDSQNGMAMHNRDSNGNIEANGEQDAIFAVNLKRYFDSGKTQYRPVLRAGDTILIPESTGHKIKNAIGFSSVIGFVLATTTVLYAIDRLKN